MDLLDGMKNMMADWIVNAWIQFSNPVDRDFGMKSNEVDIDQNWSWHSHDGFYIKKKGIIERKNTLQSYH